MSRRAAKYCRNRSGWRRQGVGIQPARMLADFSALDPGRAFGSLQSSERSIARLNIHPRVKVHGHQGYCEQECEEYDPSGTRESVGYLIQEVGASRHRLQHLN